MLLLALPLKVPRTTRLLETTKPKNCKNRGLLSMSSERVLNLSDEDSAEEKLSDARNYSCAILLTLASSLEDIDMKPDSLLSVVVDISPGLTVRSTRLSQLDKANSDHNQCPLRFLTLGVAYDYQYFPGLEHSFAIRGDPKNPNEMKGMERAKNAAVL